MVRVVPTAMNPSRIDALDVHARSGTSLGKQSLRDQGLRDLSWTKPVKRMVTPLASNIRNQWSIGLHTSKAGAITTLCAQNEVEGRLSYGAKLFQQFGTARRRHGQPVKIACGFGILSWQKRLWKPEQTGDIGGVKLWLVAMPTTQPRENLFLGFAHNWPGLATPNPDKPATVIHLEEAEYLFSS